MQTNGWRKFSRTRLVSMINATNWWAEKVRKLELRDHHKPWVLSAACRLNRERCCRRVLLNTESDM